MVNLREVKQEILDSFDTEDTEIIILQLEHALAKLYDSDLVIINLDEQGNMPDNIDMLLDSQLACEQQEEFDEFPEFTSILKRNADHLKDINKESDHE